MIALVRFIGRRLFSRQLSKRRWAARFVTAVALWRWLDRKFISTKQFSLKKNESMEIRVTTQKGNFQ
jgi:hypothetical protein